MSPVKLLGRYGPSRGGVRVLEDFGRDRIRVQWSEQGQRRFKHWPRTAAGRAEAKAFAQGLADGWLTPRPPVTVTVRELWTRYTTAAFGDLRAKTQWNYSTRWRPWEIFIGAQTDATLVTPENVMQFGRAFGETHASNQVSEHVKVIRLVYARGKELGILAVNPLADLRWRTPRDQRPNEPAEYSSAEYERILAQLNPQDRGQWRAATVLLLQGHQGPRINAVLELRWADVQADRIVWPHGADKMGRTWEQPLRDGARAALLTAWYWRERDGYTGPLVFYSSRRRSRGDKPIAYQGVWQALRNAEDRAKIPHRKWRATHGLRKMVAGNVRKATGDALLALQAIGDRDARQLTRYVQPRAEDLREAMTSLDTPESRTQPAPGGKARELNRVAARATGRNRTDDRDVTNARRSRQPRAAQGVKHPAISRSTPTKSPKRHPKVAPKRHPPKGGSRG